MRGRLACDEKWGGEGGGEGGGYLTMLKPASLHRGMPYIRRAVHNSPCSVADPVKQGKHFCVSPRQ